MNKLGTASLTQCIDTFLCLDGGYTADVWQFIPACGSLDAPDLIPAGSTVAAQQPTTTQR